MKRFFLYSLLILSFFSCANSKPRDFKPGEHRCEFCEMNIVEMPFKAEVITHKGKIHYFDSIECMMGWWTHHREETASRWVSDFYSPETWVPLEKAFILKSKTLASPMRASLSAYASEEELQQALQKYEGNRMDLSQLEFYIEHQWNEEMNKAE